MDKQLQEDFGYIYCFSNKSWKEPIMKIDMTQDTLQTELDKLNARVKDILPKPYKIELAKIVYNPRERINTLHLLMASNNKHKNQDFFYATNEDMQLYLDLMEGPMVDIEPTPDSESESDDEDNDNNNHNHKDDKEIEYNDKELDELAEKLVDNIKTLSNFANIKLYNIFIDKIKKKMNKTT